MDDERSRATDDQDPEGPFQEKGAGENPPAEEAGDACENDPPQKLDEDITAGLLRTLLGGAVEGADRVLERLGVPESTPGSAAADRTRHALIGMLFDAYGVARKGVSTAGRVASFGWSLVEPVAGPLLDPVKRPTEAMVDRWIRLGRSEEERGRETAREVTRVPIDEVVGYLRDNPEMKALVRQQAEALLAELRDDPQVQSLVRSQGDDYLGHLRENPEPVQELVQGQSVGMVNEILDVVRERATAVDGTLERIVRTALRRRPRERLPEPSSAVKTLADNPRLRSDE